MVRRASLVSVFAVACLTTSVVLAQPKPAAAPAAAPGQPSPADVAEAKKHMEAGAALYNDPSGHKCEEAYREFKKAFDLSNSANAVKAMGICALELERDGDAIAHFEEFLRLKGDKIEPADKQQVESDLKALKSAVATVTVSADRAEVTLTDVRQPSKGFPVTNRYTIGKQPKALGLHPGHHVFTVSVDGGPELSWTVDIANGGSYSHVFELDKVPPPATTTTAAPIATAPPATKTTRPVPTSVYVLGGLTVALAVPSTIFALGAKSKKDDYDAANGKKSKADLDTMRSDVQSANLLADIFIGAAAASAIATGVLYVTRPEKTEPSTTGLWVAPTVGPRGAAATVGGTF